MAKKKEQLEVVVTPRGLEKPADKEPRKMSVLDKELRRGGLAYLKEQARESGKGLKHDLGLVETADGIITKMSVVMDETGKWQYVYGK